MDIRVNIPVSEACLWARNHQIMTLRHVRELLGSTFSMQWDPKLPVDTQVAYSGHAVA
jgi:hypothetical protein